MSMPQNPTTFSDEEIIQHLREDSPPKNRQVENFLYDAFQDVKRLYQKKNWNRASLETLDTIYNDSMIPMIKKIKDGSYKQVVGTPIKAYFHGIFKLQLRSYFSRTVKKQEEKGILSIGMQEVFPNKRIRTTIEELTIDIEEKARQVLAEISPACRVKIEEIELNQLSPEDAWQTFGFKNVNAFRASYARCKKQLKDLILKKIKGE